MLWQQPEMTLGRMMACVILAAFAAGCGPRTAAVSQPEPKLASVDAADVAAAPGVYERPLRHIKQARFIKPPDAGTAEPELHLALAPIIVQEVTGTDEAASERDRFGAVRLQHDGGLAIDASEPTVYWAEVTEEIAGQPRTRLIYAWAYPQAQPGQPRWPHIHAIRLTLDAAGMPAVYEVFDGTWEVNRIFVSQRLENLAAAAYGDPLPERQHAIESTGYDSARKTFVPRVLADGPMPMGPLVYVENGSQEIITLLCRCSSSQADEFVETGNYQLVPLAALRADGVSTDASQAPFILSTILWAMPTPAIPVVGDLNYFLRLPPEW